MIARLLSLLALLALSAMPLAHMEARAHGAAPAMTGQCHGGPAAPGKADKVSIDCAITCAAIAPAGAAPVALLAVDAAGPEQAALPAFAGVGLDADPPPPRLG